MKRISAACSPANRQGLDLVVVDTTHQHGVELDRAERLEGGIDAREHVTQVIAARQRLKPISCRVSRLTVMRVSPASRSRSGLRRQQHAIGRHRQVVERADRGQLRRQFGDLRAEQWLAARQAHVRTPSSANRRVTRVSSSNVSSVIFGSHT